MILLTQNSRTAATDEMVTESKPVAAGPGREGSFLV
jgi:hypothetical protein